MTPCNNGTCDYTNTLDRTLTIKRSKAEIRYARLWAEIELPKLLRQQPEQVLNQNDESQKLANGKRDSETNNDAKTTTTKNIINTALSSKHPERKRLRLKTSQRRTQKIWEKLTRKQQINDIPTRQYATWARFYRTAYETGAIKR